MPSPERDGDGGLPASLRLLFGAALRLLPRDERERVREGVLAAIDEGWREARWRGGLRAPLAFALREWVDLVWNVIAARVPGMGPGSRRQGTTGGVGMDGIWFDLKVAVQGLLRSPALVIGTVATLGIGIGANLALFSVLHGVLLRPLPYGEPNELVAIYTDWEGARELGLPWDELILLHEEASTLASVAGTLLPGMDTRFVLETPAGPEAVDAVRVSPNFFGTLRVAPALGPGVQADGPVDAIEPAVLLPDATWRRRYGADPGVVGTTVRISDVVHRIAGVLPPDFSFHLGARAPEFYLVHTPSDLELRSRGNPIVRPVARLAEEADIDAARAELARMTPSLLATRPPDGIMAEPDLRSLQEHLVGNLRGPLLALGAAALLVLLVACANLAALFLARHTEREADQALRAALGAGRERLARLPLAESLVLGLAGGVVGVGLAWVASDLVLARIPEPLFRYDGFRMGPLVVLGAVTLAVVAGFLFGGLPAWRSGRTRPAEVLRKAGSRGADGGNRATRVLAGAEAAALLVLLVATGLSFRSLDALLDVDLGFRSEGRATATLVFPQTTPDEWDLEAFGETINRMEARLEALPGVRAAGTVTHLPLDADNWGGSLAVEGEGAEADEPLEWELASPGYFEASGIELLRGRPFSRDDGASTPMVTVVSRTLARMIRPGGSLDDALGVRVSGTGPEGPWFEIVGVVGDVQQDRVGGAARPHMYISHAQYFAFPERELVVATDERADALALLREAAPVLEEIAPRLVITRPRTLESLVHEALGRPRVVTSLLGVFGLASLLLALTGIYGITAFGVARRRREIGIRACLGAARGELFGRALGEAMVPVGIGAAAGLGLVALVAPRVEGLLYGVEPLDPVTLVAVPVLLLGAAAATAWLPALRAARLDPVEVLRDG